MLDLVATGFEIELGRFEVILSYPGRARSSRPLYGLMYTSSQRSVIRLYQDGEHDIWNRRLTGPLPLTSTFGWGQGKLSENDTILTGLRSTAEGRTPDFLIGGLHS
jgi:hypothetical protein